MYQKPLSQTQATERFSFFSNPNQTTSYKIFLKLTPGNTFDGQVTINFELQKVKEGLHLDFAGFELNSFTINGENVPTTDNYKSLRQDRFV
jgi:hypothetical protein